MLFWALACTSPGGGVADTAAEPIDLTTPLGPGEVRAGVVTDESALFGGISAEGQVGDLKLYNSAARFIIQADRPSSYYIGYGGGVIDADIVRPDGEPGRDILDEFAVMVGLGRLLDPEEITVVSDGLDGQPAEIRVRGTGGPMTLLTGTVENEDFIPDYDVEITTCYRLAPDSPLLEIDTTIRWRDDSTSLQIGGFAMLSDDASAAYHPGAGMGDGDTPEWLGVVSDRGEVALGIFPDERPFAGSTLQQLLSSIGPVLAGFDESLPVDPGDTLRWHGYLGVGADLSEASGAWLVQTDRAHEHRSGTVTAGGAPLAGARVHLLDSDGAPVTVTQTDQDGQFDAIVPEGQVYAAVATGRGLSQHTDQPTGAPWYSPLAAEAVRDESLAAIAGGAIAHTFAEGYGISASVSAETDAPISLELTPPGTLSVEVTDDRPAVVQVAFASGDPVSADPRLVPGRPGGWAAQAWLRSGEIPLEAGDYVVTLHRGLRYEPVVTEVSIASGETTVLRDAPTLSYSPEGVLVADPHAHAAPSTDGGIAMAERLQVHAANGVDLHFGTDHDNIADYRVLLEPLGLSTVLKSVVADEFSPVLRGHINVYPLEALPEANGGALTWWDQQQDTPAWFAALREQVGDGIIQVNHPLSSGMVDAARYDPSTGVVGRPDFWSDDFDTIELINDGDYDETFPYYLDMISRGMTPTPVGVSDSHGHRGAGESVTFLHLGTDDVGEYTDAAMVDALKAHATVASTGPFLHVTAGGAWAPGQTFTGAVSLDVSIDAPSWVPVDALQVYRDGELVDEIAVDGAPPRRLETTVSLEPDADAVYVLVASSSSRMASVYPGNPSWAAASAIWVDVEGDGWTPPLPAVSAR